MREEIMIIYFENAVWGWWQCAQLGLYHLSIFQTLANVAPKIPNLIALPWTLEPPGCLQWGQSGAGSQPVQTPAARLGQHAWRDEPWSESEQWAVFCGQDGNLSRDLIALGEKWLPRAQMLSQPARASHSRLPHVLHFTWAGRACIWIFVPPPCAWPPLCSVNGSNS